MKARNRRNRNVKRRGGSLPLLLSIWIVGTAAFAPAMAAGTSETADQAEVAEVLAYIKKSFPKTVREQTKAGKKNINVPHPYTVPCADGLFQNLFYWDTYFTNLGLLQTGMEGLAKNNTDNLLFLADKLGYVPNANRWEYSNRSQPPLLARMVGDIFSETKDRQWAKQAYRTLAKEHAFWTSRRSSPTGLNRNFHSATDDELMEFYTFLAKSRFKGLSCEGRMEKLAFSSHSLSEAETGWDFTPRFDRRCEDFCPTDLNANLYFCETMLAGMARALENGEEHAWSKKAEDRKRLMSQYLWNGKVGCFTDYDFVNGKQSDLVTCAALFPLWAGAATQEQAEKTLHQVRRLLECESGLAACERRPQKFVYQWDYPNGWPPLQCIAIQAMDRYGFRTDARRIAEKYVETVVKNFKKTGGLWEKYNVVTGSTDAVDEYQMPQMLGWTAGTFVFAVDYLKRTGPTACARMAHEPDH